MPAGKSGACGRDVGGLGRQPGDLVTRKRRCLGPPPAEISARGPARRLRWSTHEDRGGEAVYRAGDYVYPADLPRRVLCRVATADCAVTPAGEFQILTLEPLEGPWQSRLGGRLVRFDEAVLPAPTDDVRASEPAS